MRERSVSTRLLLNSRLLAGVDGDEWDEAAIGARADELIDAVLAAWPVPTGHEGVVTNPHDKSGGWIEVKHLVGAGLIEPGAILIPRTGPWQPRTATIRRDGLLDVGGTTFDTPTGAAKHVRGPGEINGWRFWSTTDGRTLRDVRATYTGVKPTKQATAFDWTVLHTLLEALPTGRWTTYGSLADTIGTGPVPLGRHLATCRQCTNAHRVLQAGGKLAPGFAWTDASDERDPAAMLQIEGAFVEGRADPVRELSSDDLQALIEQ